MAYDVTSEVSSTARLGAYTMTEEQWLKCGDVPRMARFLRDRLSARKWRLFACGRCRLIWPQLGDPRSRQAVEVAERFADGGANELERRQALRAAIAASVSTAGRNGAARSLWAASAWAEAAVSQPVVRAWLEALEALGPDQRECGEQTNLLREVVGNPFRVIAFKPQWRTPRVRALAKEIYDGRAFERLPVLVRMLKDAACRSPEVLSHLQSPGPHVRGCWALDLVAGKGH